MAKHDHLKKKHSDDCCISERQVNNPANDVANFPRITQSETSIAYFKNFILYGFNDSNDSTGVLGTSSFSGFAYSNDLGNTWTDGGSIPVNSSGQNSGDPVIAVDQNGVFYYGQIGIENVSGVSQGVISVSTGTITPNETITMNAPQVVGRGQNPSAAVNQDKEWIAVGPDASNPGNEALYVTWTDFTVSPPNIRFSKYTTGVNLSPIITDQVIVTVTGGTTFVQGSFVIVDDLGGIYVFYEEISGFNTLGQPNRVIRMVKSTDGGSTFPINVAVSNPFAAAATDTSICSRPSIGVDNSRRIRMNEFPSATIGPDGTIYVVWNAGRVTGGTTFIDVFLAYSTDRGATWNRVCITSNLSTFPFFPTVAATKNQAHIQYNRFNDRGGTLSGIGDGTFAVFLKSFSLCSGFGKEQMVSTIFSPVPVTNPGVDTASCYMGDYNQMIVGPRNCLLHSWGDNRDVLMGRDNPDVFFSKTSLDAKRYGCCDDDEK
ncbi:exo-alpha-sialidase [Hazenella sp. IB182353]|uniref:exo-alpha-sialidase n=1 Tax=Polycladospora coralii TaxID=2771432 RepID=UPI001745F006|nr:exo-alpha-sialidase [Polycladospora coralii]